MPIAIPQTLINELVQLKVLSETAIEGFKKTAQSENKDFGRVLLEKNVISDKDLLAVESNLYRLPIVELDKIELNKEALKEISEDIVNFYKIASFSLTNYPLLRHIAKKGKPLIMSTGLHTLGEIEEAVRTIHEVGNTQLALLQCTSHYPSAPADANLRVMDTLRSAFQLPVGYSDHTMGIMITVASVAMGANIVEKHFTFDTESFGVDHDASISPAELHALVKSIRDVEAAMGMSVKVIPEIEKEIQRVHRPSLVSRVDIP